MRHQDLTNMQSDLVRQLPANLRPQPAAVANPDDLPTSTIDVKAPTNPDGTPRLMPISGATVSPLDMAQAHEIVKARKHQWDGIDADGKPFDETKPQRHRVRDSRKHYVFDGLRLAYVSSERGNKPRWTDIEIYRTEGGMYVTHTIGITSVAHADPECRWVKIRKYAAGMDSIASDEFAIEDRTPCQDCGDNYEKLRHSDPAALLFERDFHSANIAETPEQVIQSLYTKRDGVRALGPLAVSALQIAADRDPIIAAVFYGERYDTH